MPESKMGISFVDEGKRSDWELKEERGEAEVVPPDSEPPPDEVDRDLVREGKDVAVIGDHSSKRAVSPVTWATEYGHPTTFLGASHIVRSKRKYEVGQVGGAGGGSSGSFRLRAASSYKHTAVWSSCHQYR